MIAIISRLLKRPLKIRKPKVVEKKPVDRAKGEGYFRTTGTVGGKMFSVKHCRKTCECTAEMLDQNPQLAHRVFEPTFKHEASA